MAAVTAVEPAAAMVVAAAVVAGIAGSGGRRLNVDTHMFGAFFSCFYLYVDADIHADVHVDVHVDIQYRHCRATGALL